MIALTVLCLCVSHVLGFSIEDGTNRRESRKLFGGYRITPRFCKPTRDLGIELKGPNICMFNHECVQRNGMVVGACMDGFLFGTCCQLPDGDAGELAISELNSPSNPNNHIQATRRPTTSTTLLDPMMGQITSSGVSQITSELLGGLLPTAQDNAVVQVDHDNFLATGVTHPVSAETIVLDNEINPDEFRPRPTLQVRPTVQVRPRPTVEVRPRPTVEFRPSTIMIESTTPTYLQSSTFGLKISATSRPSSSPNGVFTRPGFKPKPPKPSFGDSYVLVPTISHETRPNKTQEFESIANIIQMLNSSTTQSDLKSTSRQPPSTSYVFSTTLPPRTTRPTRITTNKIQYTPSSTFRPAHSTFANSPSAFITTKKPSTSYVYSSTISKRPTTTQSTTQQPPNLYSSSPSIFSSSPSIISSYPSPPPTVIVLSPVTPEFTTPTSNVNKPNRKPITHVTINNHITHNIYNTSEKPSPSPTVLITPKPSNPVTVDYDPVNFESETSPNDNSNFPPVRNPNLNMSAPVMNDYDITTPQFLEDEALNITVESFVNKIIQGLQEPFHGLKDIVYENGNKTGGGGSTTKKPLKKQGTTTRRPVTKTTTRRAATTVVTKRPTTTVTKRTKPTKKVTTVSTTTEQTTIGPLDQDYRSVCGMRPLVKTGRIVGGKAAEYGEFPWQVLVRESTWLGLFTKNKCGGVLISNRYVMTAAHCQPGFLASLVAVFGEFDISGNLEKRQPLSRNIKRVIVHRQYDPATFANDLALLEMDHPVHFDHHIVPICLPREGEDFTGRMATVTGWGRLKYGGGVPSVLQEVQVPIMENDVCQKMFQTAGHTKVILESFLCAGYANGQKDSCEGDSGGPLVLLRPDGRYHLAGTVSHGIKCAAPYLPGVYMRTAYYKPWIESITGVH